MKKLLLTLAAIMLIVSLSSFTDGNTVGCDNVESVEVQSTQKTVEIHVRKNVTMGHIVADVIGHLEKEIWIKGCVQTEECGPGTSEYVDCFWINLKPGMREALSNPLEIRCPDELQYVLHFHYVLVQKTAGDETIYMIEAY